MKTKRYDFTSFEQFEQSGTAGEYETLTVIDENGWLKCDIMTECKSWKTALRRFFDLLGTDSRLDGWYECIREAAENGYFKLNDFTMENGSRNEFPSYAFEIEEINEGVWYIFLNVKYTEEPEQKEEETEMNKEQEMREEARAAIIEALKDGYTGYYCDLHDEVFNTDYYIIGTYQAKKALEEYGVFDAIEKVQTYEKDNFGKIYTDLSDPEKLINMLYYIIGEEVLYEMMDGIEAWEENWNNQADEETNAEILKAIEEKEA